MKAHQKSVLDSAQASMMRRHDRHNNRNSSMVQNYKVRVADFLKQVSATPLVLDDHYGQGFTKNEVKKRRKGPASMNFGAPKGDADRLIKCNRLTNDFIDNTVSTIERVAWNMRPRDKKKEIQPQIRFNNHLQG